MTYIPSNHAAPLSFDVGGSAASERQSHAAPRVRRSVALALVLAMAGCARSTAPATPPDVVLPAETSLLERCLLEGGELTLRHAVDNDDITEHGAVISFAVSGERLAVGSVDGTIKLWTLDGFVTTLTSGALVYGPELAATEARDLDFLGEEIVSGDARGLVTAFETSGVFRVLGGTDPENSIVSVAVDPANDGRGARVAHADTHAGGNVLIRDVDADEIVGPLATALQTVSDLHFSSDGSLLVAGSAARSGGAETVGTLERFAADGTRVASATDAGAVVAVDSAGALVAAVSVDALTFYDGALTLRGRIDASAHAPSAVALSANGHVAFTIGDDETLVAWSTESGEVLASVAVPAATRLDTTPDADTAFVASTDGWLRAYGCAR